MMPTEMRIAPDWADFVNARGGDPGNCVLAQFINRKYPELTHVKVTDRYIKFSDPKTGLRHTLPTPRDIPAWLKAFDDWSRGQGPLPAPPIFVLRTGESTSVPMRRSTDEDRIRQRTNAREYKTRLAAETPEERRERQRRNTTRMYKTRRGLIGG